MTQESLKTSYTAWLFVSLFGLVLLEASSATAQQTQLTTRQQVIRPLALPSDTPIIPPSDVPEYGFYGYSAWQGGPGEYAGQRLDLMPAGYPAATNTARLLSFFTMSDIHITDKESPAEGLYYGWTAPFGAGGLSAAYSPVILSTTHVLNAAIIAVNALHRQTPFDCGLFLGDAINNSQYNELRWYLDVIDGKFIEPSSGAHRGADTIGYQKPYQAAGLDPSIPWYQVIGNHDQFWSGVNFINPKLLDALVGTNIINMGTNSADPAAVDSTGAYMGVVDGATTYGEVIGAGLTNLFPVPPTVVADPTRHSLATTNSPSQNWMCEFTNTTSLPVGHGFQISNLTNDFACYTFQPLTNLPLKVLVLDDTAKANIPAAGPTYYASGSMDWKRYNWLTNELQMGQDADQLMILAAHVPINPQQDVDNTNITPQFDTSCVPPVTGAPLSCQSDAQLIATLHNYPNLILLLAGHRHKNTVTPQPSPDLAHPELGFWEVETASLRDFPQEFRTFDIRRNCDNTISIVTVDVDPAVEEGSPAGDSRDYAIGASRIFGETTFTNITSHAYSAELVKPLTPAMQARIADYGGPLGHRLSIERDGTGAKLTFAGQLQCADAIPGPWNEVTGATSPWRVPVSEGEKFFRAVEQ
jgi:metallophosphoesterase (TIGR03768 family)